MYTFDWIPNAKASDDNDAPVFTGKVTVKIPKHMERLKALKGINLKVDSDGAVVEGDAMDAYEKQLAFAIGQIESVDLVRAEDGMVFNSVEMLEYDSDGMAILANLAGELAQGIKLGKNMLKK